MALEAAPETQFREYLSRGELWLQVCTACDSQIFFPRVLCPQCGGKPEWRPASGAATVYSSTIVRQRPDRGGDYNISIVELAEGARMMTRVEGIAPSEVQIGMPVQAVIDTSGDVPLVMFRPTQAA